MKIVFDNIIYSLQRSGGGSVVWQELTSRFIKNGKDQVLCIEHQSDKENIFRKMLDIPKDSIRYVKPLFFSLERYFNPKCGINEPYIFHSSYFRTSKDKAAINVTTIHDFTFDRFFKGKRKFAFLHIWQRNRAIKNSDAVVCISQNTKNDLFHFVPDTDCNKVFVINNGVSTDYHLVNEKDDSLNGYLLFVGQRGSYKNGEWLIEALKDTDYKIVFCGRPLSENEKQKCDLLLKDRYKVLANLSNKALNVVYNSVKCLVYPSSYEGFGIPVLEAQKAGCPVIAYNASSIPEVIGDTTLLMNELTKKELLSKLKLIDDEDIRSQIITNGLKNAEKFSWDRIYEQYHSLYSELMKKATC